MKKIYHVVLDRKLSIEDLQAIREGIRLEEGVAEVDNISFIEGKPKTEVGIEIHIDGTELYVESSKDWATKLKPGQSNVCRSY
jgi:16S rRNA U516 pseudouridylate synthase RsuA-like enzyme